MIFRVEVLANNGAWHSDTLCSTRDEAWRVRGRLAEAIGHDRVRIVEIDRTKPSAPPPITKLLALHITSSSLQAAHAAAIDAGEPDLAAKIVALTADLNRAIHAVVTEANASTEVLS